MCYRTYYLTEYRRKLNEMLREEGLKQPECTLDRSGEMDIHPSEKAFVIHEEKGLIDTTEMVWGFSSPFGKSLIANARSETVKAKAMFSDSVLKRRCIIPVSGFYEWDAYKARYRFFMPDGGLVLLAGIYHPEQGTDRFTVLTTEANGCMAPVHNRMPVMVSRSEIRMWINDDSMCDEILRRRQQDLAKEQDEGQISMFL